MRIQRLLVVIGTVALATLAGCASEGATQAPALPGGDSGVGKATRPDDAGLNQDPAPWPAPPAWSHYVIVEEFGEGLRAPEQNRRSLPALRMWPSGDGDRVFVSNIRTTPDVFRELVVSWNIEAGSTLIVDARVRRAADRAFSPWVRMGFVGPEPGNSADALREWAWGRVEVDVVTSDVDCDAWQYRLVMLAETGSGVEAFPRRVVGVTSREVERADAGAVPSGGVAIEARYLSQYDAPSELAPRVCSPTATAMALSASGEVVDPVVFASDVYDPTFDLYGNWPRNVQAAFEAGVEGYVTRFSSWNEVQRHIAAGRPIVASIGIGPGELEEAPVPMTAGHLILIRGFDGAGGVLVSDPAAADEATGELVYPARSLETVWFGRRAGTAYVFLPAGT